MVHIEGSEIITACDKRCSTYKLRINTDSDREVDRKGERQREIE